MTDSGMHLQRVLQRSALGPVQLHVLALVTREMGRTLTVSFAERSPIGPRAIRVHLDSDLADPHRQQHFEHWLKTQDWVHEVALRPPNLYLGPTLESLRDWATGSVSVQEKLFKNDSVRHRVIVRLNSPLDPSAQSLDALRQVTMAEALATLLRSQGHDTSLEYAVTAHHLEVIFLADDNQPDTVIPLTVGGVDVPAGPLRARYGGRLCADNLFVAARELIAQHHGNADRTDQCEDYSRAFVRFALVRTERSRRIQLDNLKLTSELATFDLVLSALSMPQLEPRLANGEEGARELAMELDLLPAMAQRAVNELDPAPLTRSLRTLAERAWSARARLASADPLRRALSVALGEVLEITGIVEARGDDLIRSEIGTVPVMRECYERANGI